MKLDSQSTYNHSCPQEHDTKVILHKGNPFILTKDNHFMIDMVNIDKEISREGKHGLITHVERKNFEVMESPNQYFNREDFIDRNEDDGEPMKVLNSSTNSGFEMIVKEDFYADKVVTEVEFAEMKTSNEHDPCHTVKDISIDEGVLSLDNTSAEKEQLCESRSSLSSQSLDNGENDLTRKMSTFGSSLDLKCGLVDSEAIAVVDDCPGDPAFDAHNDSDMEGSSVGLTDRADEYGPAESLEGNALAKVTESPVNEVFVVDDGSGEERSSASSVDREIKQDTAETVVPYTSFGITQNESATEESGKDIRQVDSSSSVYSNGHSQTVEVQKLQGMSAETNTESAGLPLSSEVSGLSNRLKDVPASCKVPAGVITFNFDKHTASTSGKDVEQSEVAQNGPGTENSIIDSGAASARSSFHHLFQGESSFSSPAFLSGPIANSGHIPYSGSISLRSDSSTTSARSFAFPILQSEWNSSPVKMAKADRRHLRKHRCWRTGLLCCRF